MPSPAHPSKQARASNQQQRTAQRDDAGAGQRGRVDNGVRLERLGVHQRVRQREPALRVGVEDLDRLKVDGWVRGGDWGDGIGSTLPTLPHTTIVSLHPIRCLYLAVGGREDVPGSVRLVRDHVLAGRHDHVHLHAWKIGWWVDGEMWLVNGLTDGSFNQTCNATHTHNPTQQPYTHAPAGSISARAFAAPSTAPAPPMSNFMSSIMDPAPALRLYPPESKVSPFPISTSFLEAPDVYVLAWWWMGVCEAIG